jgi:hypothetical protein
MSGFAKLGKKIGQFGQWTGEKLGKTAKTETSEEVNLSILTPVPKAANRHTS